LPQQSHEPPGAVVAAQLKLSGKNTAGEPPVVKLGCAGAAAKPSHQYRQKHCVNRIRLKAF
jgi:hypothetical protein